MSLPLPKTLTEAACIILGFEDFAHAVASCNTADEFSTKYHHTVGRTIRNEFGLWKVPVVALSMKPRCITGSTALVYATRMI